MDGSGRYDTDGRSIDEDGKRAVNANEVKTITREFRGGRGRGRTERFRRHLGDKRHGNIGQEESGNEGTEFSNRKSRSQRDASSSYADDSRIFKQLRRISREEDSERYLSLVRQLSETLVLNENLKYVRHNAESILDGLFENLSVAPSGSCRWEIVLCVGQVGFLVELDTQRFFSLAFDRLESWRSTELKVLTLKSISEAIKLDISGCYLSQVEDYLVECLQKVLEVTEVAQVMVATVDVLRMLAAWHSAALQPHFQDIIDILIGWHIDDHQPVGVVHYVSLTLIGLRELWQKNFHVAITLLSQFVEDMEDYLRDLQSELEDPQCDKSDQLKSSAKKIASFISVFTTVLHCLDGMESLPLPDDFLTDALSKMIEGSTWALSQHPEEVLTEAICELCLELVGRCEKNGHMETLFCQVVKSQLAVIDTMNSTCVCSFMHLLSQMLKQLGGSLSLEFIKSLMNDKSPLRSLRFSPNVDIWSCVLSVYHCLLALKNVPLLQETYRYIVADLQIAYSVLIPTTTKFSATMCLSGVTYDTEEATIVIMYYMTVLAEVANTRSSIITMWALSPSLVDLLCTCLAPSQAQLALHYPQVQYALLYLCYSHCHKHSHFINTCSLILGTTRQFATGSSTSEHLNTILNVIASVLNQRHVTCPKVLQLCLQWSTDLVKASEMSLMHLQKHDVFSRMLESIVATGYHHLESVALKVVSTLELILGCLQYNKMQNTDSLIHLCLHYISHHNDEIRNAYSNLLAQLPLAAVARVFLSFEHEDNEFSTNTKLDSSAEVALGCLNKDSVKTIERHFVLRSTGGYLPPNTFHVLMTFILHASQPDDDQWQENLFSFNQRIERMTRAEEWSFPVLAGQLHFLLWKWMPWEAAHHCVGNKLRTTMGKPQETFLAVEDAIKKKAREVRGMRSGLTPEVADLSKDVNKNSSGNGKPPVDLATIILSIKLLVEFVDSLEKAMFNASEGSAVAVQPPNKSVRHFFRTNKQTCIDWLSRIRPSIVAVALNGGQPEVAVRHSLKLLQEMKGNNCTQGVDFERAVMYCIRGLSSIGCHEGISGLYSWCVNCVGRKFEWIKPLALAADNRYERALHEFAKVSLNAKETEEETSGDNEDEGHLDMLKMHWSSDVFVQEFMLLKAQLDQQEPFHYASPLFCIADCYANLSRWNDLADWVIQLECNTGTSESNSNYSEVLDVYGDLSHVRALASFDSGDYISTISYLDDCVDPVNIFLPTIWQRTKGLRDISNILLHAGTSCVYGNIEGNSSHLLPNLSESKKHLDWLMQTSSLASSPSSQHLQMMLMQQVMRYVNAHAQNLPLEACKIFEGWQEFTLELLPAEFLSAMSRWAKILSQVDSANVTKATLIKLQLLSARQARLHGNYNLTKTKLRSLLGLNQDSEWVLDSTSIEFTPLIGKIHRELAKTLVCCGQVLRGSEILADLVMVLNGSLQLLAQTDPTLLSLPPNEAGHLCARSLVTLNKWWGEGKDWSILQDQQGTNEFPKWLFKLENVYHEMKPYAPEELATLCEFEHSAIPLAEKQMGQLLVLAATQCPALPKAWYHVASWGFKWGRKVLESGQSCDELPKSDRLLVEDLLLAHLQNQEQMEQMVNVLTGVKKWRHEGDEKDDQLTADEIGDGQEVYSLVTSLLRSWDIANEVIITLTPKLVRFNRDIVERRYSVLTASVKAYFRFLNIGESNSFTDGEQTTVATLRLLRLIVKHASELRDVLEEGLAETPTTPWVAIIPQLFARLNHPEPYVRGSISDLLCRVAKDCPHLVVFPAVVGSLGGKGIGKQATLTNMLAKYLRNKQRRKNKQATDVDEDLDNSEDDNDELQWEEKEEEMEELMEDDEDHERQGLMLNCFSSLVDTLSKQVGRSINDVQTFVIELRRITILWDELWLGTLSQHYSEISRKCQQLSVEIGRVNSNASLTESERKSLVVKKYDIIFKPLIFVLDQLADITFSAPETPHEKHFAQMFSGQILTALSALREPQDYFDPHLAVTPLKDLYQTLVQSSHRRSAATLKMAELSPKLSSLLNTGIAMPGLASWDRQPITIASVDDTLTILPTKTKPKKLSFQGSDGRKYTYLFKGLEDLHLDERIMQFLETVNTMLAKSQRSHPGAYRARSYSVVPLGLRSGLIQWVGSATPVFGLYKRWQQREAQAAALKSQQASQQVLPPIAVPTHVPKPSELFYSKLSPKIREVGLSLENRKEWPVPILREVFKELVEETPSDLLSRELWMCSVDAAEWWKIMQNYSISTAVMAMVGYVIGLGDRHLDNLLVNLTTGEVVHIDYNVCFEKGRNLRVPEKVPFRMTHNIEMALGVTGTEGIFRSACEQVLQTMRKGSEILLTLLEAFIYDPLVDWSPESEAGYAEAVYGGNQAMVSGARQSRQQLERGLTLSMFSVRMAEMKADWVVNKFELLNSFPMIQVCLENWSSCHDSVSLAESKLHEAHLIMSLLKEAEANPQHSLHDLWLRYKDYAVVKKSLDQSVEAIASRVSDLKNYLGLYRMAGNMFEGSRMAEWRARTSSLGLNLASMMPVLEFLRQSGQGSLAAQCEVTEVDLNKIIVQVWKYAENCIDLLTKYGGVWSNYPWDHTSRHRVAKQHSSLAALKKTFTTTELQYAIEASKVDILDSEAICNVVNLDLLLHNKMLQINMQLQKVYEKMRSEGFSDSGYIATVALNASAVFANLIVENGAKGSAVASCALLNSLTQLTVARLRADKMVLSAGEGISNMTVGGLWWLRESLVTLGGVTEVVSLLGSHSPPSSPHEGHVVKALTIITNVFETLNELVLKTSSVIVVEGMRLFSRGDRAALKVAAELQTVLETIDGSMAALSQKLTTHLRLLIMLMPSPHESAMHEADCLHACLMAVIERETTVGSDQTEMNQGQMLLMGFHLLFEGVEVQLEQLVTAMAEVQVPHPWPRVDTAGEAAEIMAPLHERDVSNVLRMLLRLKKVQTMVEFFAMAGQLSSRKRQGGSATLEDEEGLQRLVRSYASECVSLLCLGVPSYLATHLLLIHCQKLGVDVTSHIEARDIGTVGRVSLEGVVQEALETCIVHQELDPVLVSSAASTLNMHLNATRKQLLLRHWDCESETLRAMQQGILSQHLSHQWYYENVLKQRAVVPTLQPGRSTFLNELGNGVNVMLSLHKSTPQLMEKYSGLAANVQQRLKWAAGSDPTIARALEEFCDSVEVGMQRLQVLLHQSEEVASVCNATLHYEALRLQSKEALALDSSFLTLLHKCQESSTLVERFPSNVTSQEEILISLNPLNCDITSQWIHNSVIAITDHNDSLTRTISDRSASLRQCNDAIRNSVMHLRAHLTTHHKLMSDVRTLLKSMAKFENEGLKLGVEEYLTLYRLYSESLSSLVRQMLHEPLTNEKVNNYKLKLNQVSQQTDAIYDELIKFGLACSMSDEMAEEKSEVVIDKSMSNLHLTTRLHSPARVGSPVQGSPVRVGTPDERIKKHPFTGKVLQEHNAYALSVWSRVKLKLEGRDPEPTRKASVSEQVDYTIREATNIDNLATLYEGWTPWI